MRRKNRAGFVKTAQIKSYSCFFMCCQALLLLPVLVLLGFGLPVHAEPFPLLLTTGDDYPPFTDQGLFQGGMATALVRSAFEKGGYPVKEISWLPWTRGYTLTKRGAFHATFPYGLTKERAAFFLYSDPFLSVKLYAWSLSGDTNLYETEEDFRGKAYCNPHGYADFGIVENLMDRNQLRRETPGRMEQCFKMLRLKRIDFVYAAHSQAVDALGRSRIPMDAVRRSKPLSKMPHHVIVAKDLPRATEIIEAFNKGLKMLRVSGRYEALKREYNWTE